MNDVLTVMLPVLCSLCHSCLLLLLAHDCACTEGGVGEGRLSGDSIEVCEPADEVLQMALLLLCLIDHGYSSLLMPSACQRRYHHHKHTVQ